MPNIEESVESQDAFRQTACSVKFRDKLQMGNTKFDENTYSKGFFSRNQNPDWIDQKMLDMHMQNYQTKENFRPISAQSNNQKVKKKGEKLKQTTEQTEIDHMENSSKVTLTKDIQQNRKKSIEVVKNTYLSPVQSCYLNSFRQILPERTFFECIIKRNINLIQSKFSLLYQKRELLNATKSEGLHFGTKFDINCRTSCSNKMGTLKSNFMGSIFNFYQNFPQTDNFIQTIMICYKDKELLSSNARRVQIYLLKGNQTTLHIKQGENNMNLKQRYQGGQTQSITKIRTQEALRSVQNKLYLNVDKSAIPSVKNTILQDQDGREVLHFIKVGQDQFRLTVKPPFSVLSAYAFTVTSLLFKFASQ